MYNPIWWGVYIGPQQQKQPDGGGPGCMLYPLENCPTQPRIDVRNITLRDLKSTGGILPAGIIRCNETNPCTNINLESVNLTAWWDDMGWSFITEYAEGSVNDAFPQPVLDKRN